MLIDALAYRVQLGRKPLPLILGIGVHPIHVDVDVQVTDAGIRLVLESVVVADHRTAILTPEELVQRRYDLALSNFPLAGYIDVAERTPSRPDGVLQRVGSE